MNLSALFIYRPVLTTLMMIAIIVTGLFSYKLLPINVLPNVDFPTIQISVSLPGANADVMASTVALPLEKQLSTIAGITSMNSINSIGSTQITVQFDLDRNIDGAAEDVQAAISASNKQLPINLPTPPSYKKVNPADAPIYYLALTSDTIPLSDLDYYAETVMAERFSTLSGVAQVLVYGSQNYAIRIEIDPTAMNAENISIDEVSNAIALNNVNLPTGTLYGSDIYTTIQVPGQLNKIEDYENLILSYKGQNPVLLKNIAKISDSVANNKLAAWYNDKRSIVLAIQKQPNTNTIKVVDSINACLPLLQKQLPSGVKINLLFDRSESIRESVGDVKFTLILALILVVIVIYSFLRNFFSTFIPALALPISIIGTFFIMHILGYSIDNISLMALTLAVGFVVDDAIVVLENIMRHLEKGEDKLTATLNGSKEIIFTVFSMTLSLVAVFIPVLFMSGILGRLLHEFAVTISSAIVLSGIVSITITPMLCNLFLQHNNKLHDKLVDKKLKVDIFELVKEKYRQSLILAMNHRRFMMFLFLAVFLTTIFLFKYIPKGFLPDEDSGQIIVSTEAAQNISFDAMIKEQQNAADIIAKHPAVDAFVSSVGAVGRNSSLNQGTLLLRLKPREQRLGANEVIKELRKQLAVLPGIKVYLQNLATITVGGQSSKSQYQYTIQGIDQEELFNFTPKLVDKLKKTAGFIDVTSDLQISQPQVTIEIDREKAAKLGISLSQVQNSLYSAYGSKQISTLYTSTAQYQVIMEMAPAYQTDKNVLSLLNIRSTNGSLVPILAIARIKDTVGPLSISHFGQLPSVTVSFNLSQGVSLSYATQTIEQLVKESNMPPTLQADFQGTAQAYTSSLESTGILLVLAILVIYIILGMLYESFLHPITILSGLPTAGFGALLTLMLFGKELNIYGFIGLIMLIGIVKKNAIIIIDFALFYQRNEKKPLEEAIIEACLVRFRPIMMTSLSAIMGSLPIALAVGSTGEQRSSLGLGVVGGLLTSQALTLYITPIIFIYLENIKKWTIEYITSKKYTNQAQNHL